MRVYLDEGQFTETGAALGVSDGDLSVVFNPPPSTQDVVHTGGDFVPFIVVSKPRRTRQRRINMRGYWTFKAGNQKVHQTLEGVEL